MAAKPIKSLKLHYTMIQFLIMRFIKTFAKSIMKNTLLAKSQRLIAIVWSEILGRLCSNDSICMGLSEHNNTNFSPPRHFTYALSK